MAVTVGNCNASPRASVPKFMSCASCKQISYCCKECQIVDWPRHKTACKTERDKQTKRASSLEIVGNNISSTTMRSESDYLNYIQKLMSKKDDLNEQLSHDENTILYFACCQRYDKCVSLLLQHGADPNIANKENAAPLCMASQEGHDKCVSLLINVYHYYYSMGPILILLIRKTQHHYSWQIRKVMINLYHYYYSMGPILILLILQHGADLNIANKENATPLCMASQEGHDKCVSLLLLHRADPNIGNKGNLT